jgi:hypothetical protein
MYIGSVSTFQIGPTFKSRLITTDQTMTPGTFVECIFNYDNSDAVPGDTTTLISADPDYDAGADYDTSTGRFTAPSTGWYVFDANVVVKTTGASGAYAYAQLRVNGASFLNTAIIAETSAIEFDDLDYVVLKLSSQVFLRRGSYVSVWCNAHDIAETATPVMSTPIGNVVSTFRGMQVFLD